MTDNREIYRTKFRNSYDDEDWAQLESNPEFKTAWEAGNMVKAGELAPIVIFGPTRNRREAKKAQFMNRILKEYR